MIYSVIKSIYNHIRPYTPRKYVSYSGIAIKHGRLFDVSDNFEFKPEAVSAIENNVQTDDKVVDIATGHGVFSLICAVIGADIQSYEYDPDQIKDARRLHELIGVDDKIQITQGFVCKPDASPPTVSNSDCIPPSELPESDVFLLDCEGAEIQIIAGAEPTPPLVIVETHPSQGAPSDDVEDILIERGYDIQSKRSVNAGKDIIIATGQNY